MMVDLQAELAASQRAVRRHHSDRLGALGVSMAAILDNPLPCLGVVNAEVAGGLYEPSEIGEPHVLTPIYEANALIDLCAWRTSSPESWLLRRGVGWALGADHLDMRGGWDGHVILHASPLEWMAAAGVGAVILDWSSPHVRNLIECDRITVPDRTIGAAIFDRISPPARLPTIELSEVRRAA